MQPEDAGRQRREPGAGPERSDRPARRQDADAAAPAPAGRDGAGDRTWEARERRRQTGLYVRVVLGILLLVLLVVFVSLNSDPVRVHFVFFETNSPLVWALLIAALVGGAVTLLIGRPGRRAHRRYIKELERRLGGDADTPKRG